LLGIGGGGIVGSGGGGGIGRSGKQAVLLSLRVEVGSSRAILE